jgi:uncharacterized membrane protein
MPPNVFTPRIKLEYVISFSDAVFAFAITFMALTIDIPELTPSLTQSQLTQKLIDMYPQVESYFLSFFVIAIFWLSYHHVFNHIKDSHISMVYLNLLFLFLITLLSISTSLVITFNSYQISYLIYSSVVIVASLLLVIIWRYATSKFKLVDDNLNPLFIKGVLIHLLIIPLVFFVSMLISFINLDTAQYFWLVIAPLNIYTRHRFKH